MSKLFEQGEDGTAQRGWCVGSHPRYELPGTCNGERSRWLLASCNGYGIRPR